MKINNKKETTKWQEGISANPNGRPKRPGKPVSSLRKTLTKLRELEEKSLENISIVVNGKDLDKQVLETSKWVISTISSMSRAATADESLRNDIRSRAEDKEEQAKENNNPTPVGGNVVTGRFTTNLVKDLDNEEE